VPELLGFARFTELVRGHEPFPWQVELAERWLTAGRLPSIVDVPTGLGKTSVIDCWAHALACTAADPERALPLRMFVVVDRRLIVDAAFEHARALERQLTAALADGANELSGIARSLASFSGEAPPLASIRIRGGITWESRWLARPDQPAVIAGTVDQFGSRLLFRGYGASDRMRPIDAALVGTDAWLVIDEAHIAAPMLATARHVARLQHAVRRQVTRPLAVTAMTATPAELDDPGVQSREAFRADPEEQMCSSAYPSAAAEAKRRLQASKPVALVELPPAKGKATALERGVKLGAMLAALAFRVDPVAQLIGVLCNTIAAARAAHARLLAGGERAALLIGRSREYERDRVLGEWRGRIEVGAVRDGMRCFVVATQTIEVGANLDFDAAVCELAPLDSLVQRFGRVNRIGARAPHCSVIAHWRGYHDSDPVYGGASEETWEYLLKNADRHPTTVSGEREIVSLQLEPLLDFGPLAVRELTDDAPPTTASEPGYVPVPLGSDVERWAATSPAPTPEQAVGPFLRGQARSAPEVSVAWRAAPPVGAETVAAWNAWLTLARPVEWEFVSVPIWEARGLLSGEPSGLASADLEGDTAAGAADGDGRSAGRGERLLGVSYRSDSSELTAVRGPYDIGVGRHIVLRSDLGGHDRWGWTGVHAEDGGAVADVADLAPTRRGGIVRIDERVLASVMGAELREQIGEILGTLDPNDLWNRGEVVAQLSELCGVHPLGALLARAQRERWWLEASPLLSTDDDVGEPACVLVLRERRARRPAFEAITDADEASSSQAGTPESLSTHQCSVASLAAAFATHLGLDHDLCEAIERAASWHDLGKADRRFQAMLHDGDQLAALLSAEPWAKSGRDPADPLARLAARLAGVPRGFRHEAVSTRIAARLIKTHPKLVDGLDADLVLHLVASHHGCGRPLFPALLDEAACPVRVGIHGAEPRAEVEVAGAHLQVDWRQPARFERLCEHYGWWGLALLEAIVRLADMLASERGGGSVRAVEPAEAAGASR
jgi:CRISPR-associated endonuclease/helicase Cas3